MLHSMKDSIHLQELRGQIDIITRQLVQLLNKRAELALQIGKTKHGLPIYDPAREAMVLSKVVESNAGPLSNKAVTTICREIIAACRAIQQPLRIAYLGPTATYSEEAVITHYGHSCELLPCTTIDDAVRAAESSSADLAVVPVENSSEGSVPRTLDLLLSTNLTVIGEIALPIHHQLLAHADRLAAIREVMAHPQALSQCRAWLSRHLPQATQTPATSNSAAAQYAAGSKVTAAIASTLAATQYDLPTLAKNIEDESHNTTRFLSLGKTLTTPSDADKTSLIFATPNRPGALAGLLDIIATAGINMLKLESRPARHTPWDYIFYLDIEGHRDEAVVRAVLEKLQAKASFVKILGSYPKAKAYE